MQVHRDINSLPSFNKAVITIGTFDGVHTGHLQIINQLKKEALEIGGETVIITFHPHPRMVLRNKKIDSDNESVKSIRLLSTLSEKIELLQQQQIDHLVVVPFTQDFAEQSAEAYISNFLVSKFHPHTIIIGYDHRFGKNRAGDYKLLEAYQANYQYKVKEIPEQVLHNVIISSTRIRNALSEGNVTEANEALGYSYFFEGKVVEGNKLGRTIGYPTANIEINDDHKLIPANGVYAVEVSLDRLAGEDAQHHNGMMNIGVRPTIGGTKQVIEVNIFDFEQSIYGGLIRVYVKNYLRPEVKFNGLDKLKAQLADDKKDAIQILNNG
ncbi:MAG: bifunctional riboflavin kinase/FAD synthetase [Ginsengibacter sp.]